MAERPRRNDAPAHDHALVGKAIVVTGAARGLGTAYVTACVKAGAAVVANDIDEDVLDATTAALWSGARQVVKHPADVSDWQAAHDLIAHCVDRFGHIDGLINNAGRMIMSWPQEQEHADARAMIDANLLGPIACGTAALRHMMEQRSGAIVNITSGTQMGAAALAVYGATKAAVAGLTYSWAVDAARFGVRVNALSPNAHTRMADEARRFGTAAGGQNMGIPPSSNAPLAVYLLSEHSCDLTGQVLRIDGGDVTVCSHPANLEPVLHREEWTVHALAEAFDTQLREHLQPLGVRTIPDTAPGHRDVI